MERRSRVRLLTGSLATVFRLVGVKRERWLLRVVAVMLVVMRVALHTGGVCSSVTIIMRMWGPPYLDLLGSSGSPLFLVGEASVARPLLLLVERHPDALLREAAVVAPPTNVVMGVVAATLGADLSASRRRGRSLTGCPG